MAEQAARARGVGSRGSEARKARPLGEVSGGREAGSEGGEVRATTDLRPRDRSSSRWQGARSPRTLSSHVTLPHGLPARPWPQEGRPGHFRHGLSPHAALLQGHTGSEAMRSPEQGARRDSRPSAAVLTTRGTLRRAQLLWSQHKPDAPACRSPAQHVSGSRDLLL